MMIIPLFILPTSSSLCFSIVFVCWCNPWQTLPSGDYRLQPHAVVVVIVAAAPIRRLFR